MPIESIVRQTIARHGMLRARDRVLVAASGGADSTALLHLLAELRSEIPLAIHVAHLDHGWRGAGSAADRAFVESMASRLDLPFTGEVLPADAGSPRPIGREAHARALRYRFLRRTARRVEADRIATGHTRDDQAETVLLRLLRGAGARGLAGIPPVRGPFVRPLIDTSRAQVEAWLRGRGIAWRDDPSNCDPAIERNRVRHGLLPYLEREFRPGVSSRLAAAAELLRDDDALLEELAAARCRALAAGVENGVAVSVPGLRAEHPALARRVLRRVVQGVGGGSYPPARDAVERLRGLAAGTVSGPFDLPGGLRASLQEGRLLLRGGPPSGPPGPFTAESGVPGQVRWPEAGIFLRLQEVDRAAIYVDIKGTPREIAYLDRDRTGPRLILRSRREGDAFYPLGLGSRKGVRDFLADEGVPGRERDRIGLLTARGEVAWVVGHRIDDRFKVTGSTRKVLIVSQEPT